MPTKKTANQTTVTVVKKTRLALSSKSGDMSDDSQHVTKQQNQHEYKQLGQDCYSEPGHKVVVVVDHDSFLAIAKS
jgi:hypothetical protein